MTADAVGGVWTYCVELAHALAPHGVEVHLATMGPRPSAAQRAEAGAFASVHESDFPLEWADEPWTGVAAAGRWLLELEEATKADVVHLNGYVHAELPWRAPVLVVGHSDVVSWWRAVHGGDAPDEWRTYHGRVRAGLLAADRVVAPTRAAAHDLGRAYGARDVAVVPNCRRPQLFPPGEKQPRVLASGRAWDAAKGLDALCRVAPRLTVPVAVAGHLDTALPGVEALGRLSTPELAAELARTAVFAAPARYEPFGLGPLEAALAGCALVLGDLPSLREVWGEAAEFVADDAALATALTRLGSDPVESAELGRRARQRALGYSPERTAAGYLEQYALLPVRAGGAR
jgi:glycosyltransferase involved in cell wall biosynthesis